VSTADCAHTSDFESLVQIHYLPQEARWLCTVKLRCDNCQQQFSWQGLNSGHANGREPVTSADGYELRAPIAPHPGGVVGLLAHGGLEHALEDFPMGPR
jgi:hypothetical protein